LRQSLIAMRKKVTTKVWVGYKISRQEKGEYM